MNGHERSFQPCTISHAQLGIGGDRLPQIRHGALT